MAPKPSLPDPLPPPAEGGAYEDGVLVHQTVEEGPTGVPQEKE